MTPRPDPLKTAENAILAAAAALADVRPDPVHPIAKTALWRARTALMTASNSLHLARIAEALPAKATGHRIIPPDQARAAL